MTVIEHENSIGLMVKTLSNQFLRLAMGLHEQLRMQFEEVANITEVHGRVIQYLFDKLDQGPVYQRDVEKVFTIRRSTATLILQKMERSGLIRREVSSDDARLKRLVLTERAKQIHPIAVGAFMKLEERARAGLSEAEIGEFLRIARKISENIR